MDMVSMIVLKFYDVEWKATDKPLEIEELVKTMALSGLVNQNPASLYVNIRPNS
jgi:hypothetical protein